MKKRSHPLTVFPSNDVVLRWPMRLEESDYSVFAVFYGFNAFNCT